MAGARVDADGAWIRGPRSAPPTSRNHDCEPAGSIAASAQLRPCVPALSARSSTMLAPSGNVGAGRQVRAARQVQLAGQHQRGRLAVVRQRAQPRRQASAARQRRRRREHAARAQARVGRQRDALRQQRAGRIQQRAVGIVHGGCQDGASGQRQRLRQGARHRQHGARREPRLRQGQFEVEQGPDGKVVPCASDTPISGTTRSPRYGCTPDNSSQPESSGVTGRREAVVDAAVDLQVAAGPDRQAAHFAGSIDAGERRARIQARIAVARQVQIPCTTRSPSAEALRISTPGRRCSASA